MAENLKLARLYLLLLAIFTVGKFVQGALGVPYEKGHYVFSIVIMTIHAGIFYGAFCRRWRRYRLWQSAGLAITLGLISQVVIFVATLASYALGLHTYFNHPRVLNAEMELSMNEALTLRAFGLVGGPIENGAAAFLGWLIGGVLPERKGPAPV